MAGEFTNQQIADLLREVAAAIEVKGGDFFRIRAYQNAAAGIEHATSSLKDLWQENQLDQVPGVGKNIALHIEEFIKTGRVREFDREMADLPQGMFALLPFAGIGAKKAHKLAVAFRLNDRSTAVKKMLAAAEKGLIRELPTFGVESEKDILTALNSGPQTPATRFFLPQAETLADEVISYLKTSPLVLEAEPLGSLRRRSATVGDIDIAVSTTDPAAVMDHLKAWPQVVRILAAGDKTTMFVHSSGHQVDIKTQTPQSWGSMLQHYTGSKLHNIHLRTLSQKKHLSLSEHGIKQGNRTVTFVDESAFYRFLGLDYIPPELREDTGEIEAAADHTLPQLVGESDIKGDLHIHTDIDIHTSHDTGSSPIKDILAAADSLGYSYLGLSDHNPKQALSPKEVVDVLKRRREEIEKAVVAHNSHDDTKPLKVFQGLEVDIRPDGSLALPDAAFDVLDYAIVSIHSRFNQDQKTATARVLKALSYHPKVKILGHPTGRLLQAREGLDYDWDELFFFAAKNRKFLEINSTPNRLDLPDSLIRQTKDRGVSFVINTDSHHIDHLPFIRYGVWTARRGWLSSSQVINTLPVAEISRLIS